MLIAETLKKSILQAAIQGKLTDQLPSDGSAKDLLAKIKAEKQKLTAEGKIKKEKPLAPITDDEKPFEIPENWEWVRLGCIISISSGVGLTAHQMKKGNIPVYGGNGITGYHDMALVDEETVVIGRVGFYCGSVHVTQKHAWITDNAFLTTYPNNEINREFLVLVLRYLDLGKNTNATAQPVVSGKKIYPMLFPLPPLAEQKRIVERVEELFAEIEKLEKDEKQLEELQKAFPTKLKNSLLQAAMQGKLTSISDEFDVEICEQQYTFPKNWAIKKMKATNLKYANGNYAEKYPRSSELSDKGDVPFLRANNIRNGLITSDELKYISAKKHNELQRGHLKINDIIVTIRGNIGLCGIVPKELDNANLNAQLSVIRIDDATEFAPEFLNYLIMSPIVQKQFEKNTTGTALKQLSEKSLHDTILVIPSIAEQKRIVEKLEELLPLCEDLAE